MIIGIDPGLNGAIAMVDYGEIVALHDMPVCEVKSGKTTKRKVSAPALAAILRGLNGMVIIEQVGAMPGQGVTSMFGFGKSAGIVEGVCAGLGLPVTLVTPQKWQKASGKREGKDGSRQRAMELYPLSAGLFSRAKDDGRADAALIATFGGKI